MVAKEPGKQILVLFIQKVFLNIPRFKINYFYLWVFPDRSR